jgi:Raf kinase inhibitor-like YbhB/YbcL family protein
MTSLFAVSVLVAAGCNDDGRTLRPAGPGQNASVSTTSAVPSEDDTLAPFPELETAPLITLAPLAGALSVTAPWADGGTIDGRYTCNGANISPGLSWSIAPAGTAEIAITMSDSDAPNFVHWAMAGINPDVTTLAEGVVPPGAIRGVNTSGQLGYTGPCPPSGTTHTYYVTVHYLDQQLDLADGVAGSDLRLAIDTATAASTATRGTYSQP